MRSFGKDANSAVARLEAVRGTEGPVLSVKIPPHYRRLVDQELEKLGRIDGPLYSVVMPRSNRFDEPSKEEPINFVDDYRNMPEGLERVIVHRYPGKLLYFPTQFCIGHCQYCFRPDITGADSDGKRLTGNLAPETLQRVQDYLRDHSKVREIIFSGGDPLACRTEDIEAAVASLLEVPSVKWVRFHTKAPIFSPAIIHDGLIEMLCRYQIRLVLHIVHPYELCSETVDAIERLRAAGVRLYNQMPLLKGINDHPAVILELAYRAAAIGVQMLSIFVADPIRYATCYRLRLDRAYGIVDEVFRRGEAWISNFRLCLDTPIGKVQHFHIVSCDREADRYVFERDGKRIAYIGLGKHQDRPTPVCELLYDGAQFVDLADWVDETTINAH
jgi:KamA family protein